MRDVRVLLLQARRPDDPSREHELACFAEKIGLTESQIDTHDLLDGPPSLDDVLEYDALLIGGSGDFYVSKRDLPHFDRTLSLLRQVVDRGHPTFGSCFGYQCLVETLGGRIIHDPPSTEVGTFELELTEEGSEDPLFRLLPRRFNAQMGHKDRAAILPEGIPNLASSERSPLQALRVPGKPIWATQFHPELCFRTNRERFDLYQEGYAADARKESKTGNGATEFGKSEEASLLLRRFLELLF